MRYLIHEDAGGFRWRKGIPNNADDSEASFGVTFGPPDLGDLADQLDWSPDFHRRLHNQLADRELWTWPDVRRRGGMGALVAAVMGAAKGDAGRIADLYKRLEGR